MTYHRSLAGMVRRTARCGCLMGVLLCGFCLPSYAGWSPEGVWRQKDCGTAWMMVTAVLQQEQDVAAGAGLYDVTLYGTGECGDGAEEDGTYGVKRTDGGTGLDRLLAPELPAGCEVRARGRLAAGELHGAPVSFRSDFGAYDGESRTAGQVRIVFARGTGKARVTMADTSSCGLGVAFLGEYERAGQVQPPPVPLHEAGVMRYGPWRLRGSRSTELDEFVQWLGQPVRSAFSGLQAGNGAFTAAWRRMEQGGAAAFRSLQYRFVKERQYDALLEVLWRGVIPDVGALSPPVHDVLWSVALRHGSGSGVVRNAVSALREKGVPRHGPEFEWFLVQTIYTERMRVREDGQLHYYAVYPADVQVAVDDSLKREQDAALAALLEYRRSR